MPRPHPSLLALCLLASTATAQFVNRATWLGSEEEGVRRNFTQGSEYFLDRFGYVVVAPWMDRGLRRFGNRADIRFGSTSRTQFTVEGQFDHRIDLGDGFAFRYHVLQSENRDTRYLRNELAVEYAIGDRTAVFAQGSLFADKSLIDVSVGAWLFRHRDNALRVMLTAVDAPSARKSRIVDYTEAPYAAMVSGAFGDTDSHRVVFEVAGQLPFEQRELADDDRLSMQRWIGNVQSHLRLAERDVLVTALESEWTDKQFRPAAAGSALFEDFDRTFHQVRAEWWRDTDAPWSIGLLHTWHDEDGLRPNDPASNLRTRRRETFGIVRLQWRIDAKLSFEPQLFAGVVDDRVREGVDEQREHGFEGKINWNTRWDFSPDISLALVVGTQLDELAFGGGGAQFVARF